MQRRALIAALLALSFGLRALVPVGYMLHAPGDEPAEGIGGQSPVGLALVLCPTQNPGLDLSRLVSVEQRQGAHHDHAHHLGQLDADTPDRVTADVEIAAMGDCGLWLSSLALAIDAAPAIAIRRSHIAARLAVHTSTVSRHDAYRAPPRGPPHLV